MNYAVAIRSEKGHKERNNQDSYCMRRISVPSGGELLFSVVCDGMGGLADGELASTMVVEMFARWFDDSVEAMPALCARGFHEIKRQWAELIREAHGCLLIKGQTEATRSGTTLVALLAYGTRYLAVCVGDSRIYERGQTLIQLTNDQSLVAKEVAAGRITADEARHHPQRNILLQCIGAGGEVLPEFSEGVLHSDSIYLLCTDGLVHELSWGEMCELMDPLKVRMQDALGLILEEEISLCRQRGESDDITGILVLTSESRHPSKEPWYRRLIQQIREWRHPSGPMLPMLLESDESIKDS